MTLKHENKFFPMTVSICLILVFLIATLQHPLVGTFKASSPDPGLVITTKTDKQTYLLRQRVTIAGNITFDGLPANNLVVIIQVLTPTRTLACRTLQIGNPTQTWPIDITSIQLTDSVGNPINTAKTNSLINVAVSFYNWQLTPRFVYMTFTVFDGNMIPIRTAVQTGTIDQLSSMTLEAPVEIPSWAVSGKALICANAYTQEPKTGGIALSLEKTAYYCISRTQQGLMDYPSLPPPPPQTTPGTYKTNITLPPDPKAGTYNVYVLGQAGPITTSSATTTFTVEDSTGYPPQASFAYWPAAPYLNMTVNFDASSSTPEGFNDIITAYEWDFGDGTPKLIRSNPTITYNYQQAKTFTVTLNVTDSEGLWCTTSKPITIYPEFGPTANFTWTPTQPYVNQTITFDASKSTTGWCANTQRFSPIQNYTWNFGDGTGDIKVTDPIIYHSYGTLGNRTVTLTVTDADGRSNQVSAIIEVLNVTLKMYDVDGNNKIDLADVLAVAIAYGSFPGYPTWNPACDFNHDDKIDLDDYLGVALHYGQDP
jgi:PKD repeat protein